MAIIYKKKKVKNSVFICATVKSGRLENFVCPKEQSRSLATSKRAAYFIVISVYTAAHIGPYRITSRADEGVVSPSVAIISRR